MALILLEDRDSAGVPIVTYLADLAKWQAEPPSEADRCRLEELLTGLMPKDARVGLQICQLLRTVIPSPHL